MPLLWAYVCPIKIAIMTHEAREEKNIQMYHSFVGGKTIKWISSKYRLSVAQCQSILKLQRKKDNLLFDGRLRATHKGATKLTY